MATYLATVHILIDATGADEAAEGISETLRETCLTNSPHFAAWEFVQTPRVVALNMDTLSATGRYDYPLHTLAEN